MLEPQKGFSGGSLEVPGEKGRGSLLFSPFSEWSGHGDGDPRYSSLTRVPE